MSTEIIFIENKEFGVKGTICRKNLIKEAILDLTKDWLNTGFDNKKTIQDLLESIKTEEDFSFFQNLFNETEKILALENN